MPSGALVDLLGVSGAFLHVRADGRTVGYVVSSAPVAWEPCSGEVSVA